MKRWPATLRTLLDSTPDVTRVECFLVSLPNGQQLCATTGQFDVTFTPTTPGWTGPQTTFYARKYGVWERGAIVSQAGFNLASNTMQLTCNTEGELYPGTTMPMPYAAVQHMFDGADVAVYAAYFPLDRYGDTSTGIETKFAGTITKAPTLTRGRLEYECADPLFLLNIQVPVRVFQTGCGWEFADENCGLDPAAYTTTFAAGTGGVLAPGAGTADEYFTGGVVTCLTGANKGLAQTVESDIDGVLTLAAAWILPVVAGDTFSVIHGCDKTPLACHGTKTVAGISTDNYAAHYGGQPFIPPASTAI